MKKLISLFKIIDSNPNLVVLAILFNCAILLDFHDLYSTNPIVFLLLFLSVFVNFINSKYWYSVLFSFTFSLFFYVNNFPRLANHSNLELFFEIFMVLFILIPYLISRHFNFKFISFQYVVKIALICIYFLAGFNKLNEGFFDTQTSCSNLINQFFYEFIFNTKVVFLKECISFFLWATILMEMIVPFGLLFQKTEKITVITLLVFHGYLGMIFYADFSSFAGFLLLLCTVNLSNLSNKWMLYISIYIAFAMLAIAIEILISVTKLEIINVNLAKGLVFAIGWFSLIIYFIKNYKLNTQKLIIPYEHVIFCLVFFISWSLKAYLGFGNLANLTMFSNLTTEKSRSNHFFINTNYTKMVNFEEDYIELIYLDNKLAYEKLDGFCLPMVEFKYKIKEWSVLFEKEKLEAKFVYKKDTIFIKNLQESSYNNAKWYYKYLYFRKIQPKGTTECYW